MSRLPRLSPLVLSLAVLLSSLVIGAPRAGAAVCSEAFGTFSAINPPSACWRPYSSTSPFNRELPSSPTLAPNSSEIIANLQANHVTFEGGGSSFAFTTGDSRLGVYYSQPGDPLVTIHCTYYWGPHTCQGSDGVDLNGKQIRVPAGAQPQDGIDMHMTIVDQATNTEYDFEHATWSSDHTTLDVYSGGETAIGNNLGDGLGSGATAADFASLAGLISEPELAGGAINHALSVVLPCTTGYVYPATLANGFPCSQMDNHTAGAEAPLGTLFQLDMTDAQIATSGAANWEKAIMTAMAHYGLYVNDTGGNGDPTDIDLEAIGDTSYTSLGGQPRLANFMQQAGGTYYAPLQRWILTGPPLPISNFRVIDPCVAQATCPADPAPGGPSYPTIATTTATTTPTPAPIPTTPTTTPPVRPTAAPTTIPTPTSVAAALASTPPAPSGGAKAKAKAKAAACATKRRRGSRIAARRRCTVAGRRLRHRTV